MTVARFILESLLISAIVFAVGYVITTLISAHPMSTSFHPPSNVPTLAFWFCLTLCGVVMIKGILHQIWHSGDNQEDVRALNYGAVEGKFYPAFRKGI